MLATRTTTLFVDSLRFHHAFYALPPAALGFLLWWLCRVPGPPFRGLPFQPSIHKPILGCAAELQEIISGLKKICVDHANSNGISSFRLFGKPCVSVLEADHVRKVLLASNFRQPIPLLNKHLTAFLGKKALVMLMHDEWKAHRHLMTRAFHFEHLQGMVEDMAEVADALAARVVDQNNAVAGRGIDMFANLKLATLDAIGLTAFGYRFDTVKAGSHPVVTAFNYLLDECTRRQFNAPLSPEALCYSLPTTSNRRFAEEARVLRSCVDGIVAARIAEGPPTSGSHEDLLKYMLEARNEACEDEIGAGDRSSAAQKKETVSLTDEALTDNLLTLLFGGFDTTSIALAYTLYSVAQHSEVEARLLAEILDVVGHTSRITYEHIANLKYCQAVITESLRLYPPAPLTVRSLEKPLRLTEDGPELPPGTLMYLPIWWIHRSEANWGSDASDFKPERHLEGIGGSGGGQASKSAGSFRMIAFSGGQRNCPGKRFAMLEATVLLATLLRAAKFSVAEESKDLRPISSGVVQKPQSGQLWMHVEARLF